MHNESEKPGVLLVDDEANVLSSLKRLLRGVDCKVFTADSGKKGLEYLREHSIDLVISDMRMPEMDGAEFLTQVYQQWPDTIRFLLTGFSDIQSTVSAINDGHIHNYISKPWDDSHLKLSVIRALEQAQLTQEKERLERLTQKQNDELQQLNESLEEKVQQRTQELQQTLLLLEESYQAIIPVFSHIIDLLDNQSGVNSRDINNLVTFIARELDYDDVTITDLSNAAHLYNIGKIILADHLRQKPFMSMTKEEAQTYKRYPVIGSEALSSLEKMHHCAEIIYAHRELFDGSGFPEGIRLSQAPQGANVLSAVIDFFELQQGLLIATPLSMDDALAYLHEHAGSRYDPQVLPIIEQWRQTQTYEAVRKSVALPLHLLQAGMQIAQDILTQDNVLLIAKDCIISDSMIKKLYTLEKRTKTNYQYIVFQA